MSETITATEHPILFSPRMVRALLAGTKTQTRRMLKKQPGGDIDPRRLARCRPMRRGKYEFMGDGGDCEISIKPKCFPGDVLWVRETWQQIVPLGSKGLWRTADLPCEGQGELIYYADCPDGGHPPRWRSPIHMFRWASRIRLEVTKVRVQRVQDIRCYDIRAEGVDCPLHDFPGGMCTSECPALREAFRDLWNSINGKDSWDANRWVRAISFRRLDA